jgi:hypothetical protein
MDMSADVLGVCFDRRVGVLEMPLCKILRKIKNVNAVQDDLLVVFTHFLPVYKAHTYPLTDNINNVM